MTSPFGTVYPPIHEDGLPGSGRLAGKVAIAYLNEHEDAEDTHRACAEEGAEC
ncbi:MAG: hypothetical protein RIS94_725 [Pseudomonadota bacterium]|jgi:hypothetical protein